MPTIKSTTPSPKFTAALNSATSDKTVTRSEAKKLRELAVKELKSKPELLPAFADTFEKLSTQAGPDAVKYMKTVQGEFADRKIGQKAADRLMALVASGKFPKSSVLGAVLLDAKNRVEVLTNCNRGLGLTVPIDAKTKLEYRQIDDGLVKVFSTDPELKALYLKNGQPQFEISPVWIEG
jgi:hypothetical protein